MASIVTNNFYQENLSWHEEQGKEIGERWSMIKYIDEK